MMRIINSLSNIFLDAEKFPFFFSDKWLEYERNGKSKSFILFDDKLNILVPFKVTHLKLMLKGEYLYTPLDTEGKKITRDCEFNFLNSLHKFIKLNHICDVIYPPQHFCVFQSIPKNVKYYEIGIIYVSLTNDWESKLSSENRRQIRRAKDANIKVQFENKTIFSFYDTYVQSMKKNGIPPYSIEFFKQYLDYFKGNVIVGCSQKESFIEAGIFDFYDNKSAYSFFSGTADKLSMKGSKKLLISEEFKFLRQIGVERYFFGGYRPNLKKTSALHSIQKFKLEMGGEIELGYHFIVEIRPFKIRAFNLALKVKSIFTRKKLSIVSLNGVEIKKSE